MMHAGLLAMLPGAAGRPEETAGAFSATKSVAEGRLIGDRRCAEGAQNEAATERGIACADA